MLAQRPSIYHVQFYFTIYEQTQVSFSKGNADAIHGALLVVGAMLTHTGDFMVPRFDDVCEAVLSVREHKSKLLRVSVVELLPRLAGFCPDAFARSYLQCTLSHLVKAARPTSSHQELRAASFLALGKLALAMKEHLLDDLPSLVSLAHDAMADTRKSPFCPEVLECTANLVEAMRERCAHAIPKPNLTPRLRRPPSRTPTPSHYRTIATPHSRNAVTPVTPVTLRSRPACRHRSRSCWIPCSAPA